MPALSHGNAAGGRHSPTYVSWHNMRQRCRNPKNTRWGRYGGRGIKVCERWDSFANFLADMGERPLGLTLERNNNDGDYVPSNCRWATRREQLENTRRTRLLTHDGVTMCIKAWARRVGLGYSTLNGRLGRGWPLALALRKVGCGD